MILIEEGDKTFLLLIEVVFYNEHENNERTNSYTKLARVMLSDNRTIRNELLRDGILQGEGILARKANRAVLRV